MNFITTDILVLYELESIGIGNPTVSVKPMTLFPVKQN